MKKNEIMSTSTKEEIAKRAVKRSVDTLLSSEKLDPVFCKEQLTIPKSRKTIRFNVIDEYITLLSETGWGIKDFQKRGYSRHQIAFYNYIIKNGAPITKAIFEKEYKENYLSLKEISKKYSIPSDHITHLRDYYGIKTIGSKGLARGKNTISLSEGQKEVLYGTMLGDATISNGGSLVIKHSGDQEAYLRHLHGIFKNHCTDKAVVSYREYDDRYDSESCGTSFHTRNHRELKECWSKFYVDGKKIVPDDIYENLTAKALAYLYMDDGYTGFRKGVASSKIYTCGFSFEDNEKLCRVLMVKFDIDCSVRVFEGKGPGIVISKYGFETMRKIISPYIIDSMIYKVKDVDRSISKKHNWLEKTPTKTNFKRLMMADQNILVDKIFNHYREVGFPYFELSDFAIRKSFDRIVNWKDADLFEDEEVIKMNNNSTNIIWDFQSHAFEMAFRNSKTPIEIFNDDILFKDAIAKRLYYGGTCTKTGMRAILKDYSGNRGVSNFVPSTAKAVYSYFGKKLNSKMRVLDFCAGFGGRMLGAMGSGHVDFYAGIDPLVKTADGLKNMYDHFDSISDTNVVIVNDTAENALLKSVGSYDLIFTCPPYFNLETYSLDESQSCVKYPDYESWLDNWLVKVSELATELLEDHGYFAIVLGKVGTHNIEDDFSDRVGHFLTQCGSLKYKTGSNVYNLSKKPTKYNNVLIFKKKRKEEEMF